ncbi:hypothetical protein FA13DRAFT_1789555 [Coprinellus micaceus]|uniref:BBC1/AIM3 cysteine proteinase-fold domain-containing protein n=1 Tax=Coprinellus micaceus TaxID=71717 RepID=A0A4Y7TIE9_COPMI|nr:hypothetical protein FA13DRAFT_1789555 [Coprinellus micaceus]
MPSFADIKAKATSVANSGVEKARRVKDNNTSVAMKKTNWDPYSGQPPPPPPPLRSASQTQAKPEPKFLPPPSRTGSNSSGTSLPTRGSASPGSAPPLPSRTSSQGTPPPLPSRSNSMTAAPPLPSRKAEPIARISAVARPLGPPPPVARSTRPDFEPSEPSTQSRAVHSRADAKEIDWANLSQEDKEVFFSWLDEFFSKHLNITVGPRTAPQKPFGSKGAVSSFSAPPPLNVTSKPTSWARTTGPGNPAPSNLIITSYPPSVKGDSAAADLAQYFSPSTRWEGSQWYNTPGALPPPVAGSNHIRTVSSWQSRGSTKTTSVGVLFSDLSVLWGSVTFNMTNPGDQSKITRQAWYLPRPEPQDLAVLADANETYGDTIAQFAESFLGAGTYCARGECWDLANEALKYFDQYDYIPKPVPSISRTHGHLIYEGKATKKGKEMGGYALLGDPDHTAVIVSDGPPIPAATKPPHGEPGASIPPSDLGRLTVVEQSVGQPPVRKDYSLHGLEEGEIWIYRPIALETYLGISDLTPTPPENHPRIRQV